MPIASFQKKVFQVSSDRKYPFNGLGWSGSLDTEAQEKLKDKPSTYVKGISLDTLSIEIPLRNDFGIDVRTEIEQWEEIKAKAVPDYFILGSKPLGKNKWLLKSVGVSETEVDGRGRIIKALLKLDFEEYVRAGKSSAKTGKGATNLNLSPSQYIMNPPNKAEEKRSNPNSAAAMARLERMDNLYSQGV